MENQTSRKYKDILQSFISELNSKGSNLDYDKLTDNEKLELLSILKDQCQNHMRPYVVHVLGYQWTWIHDLWFDMFKKYDINCIIASRGLGKSFFWTRELSSYLSFIVYDYKTIISSYNEDAVFDFMKMVRSDFEDNEFLFSKVNNKDKAIEWNKTNLELGNKSIINGISITSQIRRKHVNNFIADDILNDEQKMTPEQIKRKIFLTILPVLERQRGRFQLVGTRFSEDDIYEYFREHAKENKTWNYVELRIELDEKNEKIYIVHEDAHGEVSRRIDTDNTYDYQRMLLLKMTEPNYFAREYECKIVSDADVPFPLSALMDCKDRNLSYVELGDGTTIYNGGMDSSNSVAKDSDETTVHIGHMDSDYSIVLDLVYGNNTLEAPERLAEIKKRLDMFGRPNILTEQNSMGKTNIDMLNREGYRMIPFNTDRNKKNDITDYASLFVKRRKVRFPYKTPKDQKITDKVIHQLAGVRQIKTKGGLPTYTGTTKHDDHYMGFVLMVKQLASKGRPTIIRSYTRDELKREKDD